MRQSPIQLDSHPAFEVVKHKIYIKKQSDNTWGVILNGVLYESGFVKKEYALESAELIRKGLERRLINQTK